MLRKDYRDRTAEREHLHALIEDLHDRFHVPILIFLYKGNNASLMKLSLSSELIHTIIFEEYSSAGHYINSALEQVKSPYCCVLWNDTDIGISLDEQLTRWLLEQNCICAVPFSYDNQDELLPSIPIPLYHKDRGYEIMPVFPVYEGKDVFFPSDYMGIYDVELFKSIHGYDTVFIEGFWQLSDFGFSSWLRGKQVKVCLALRIRYLDTPPVLNTSRSTHKRRFEAKHFKFSLDAEHKVQISRWNRKLIPDHLKDDYRRESKVLCLQGKELIAEWRHGD